MKTLRDQSGISAVEVLLVLILLAILGFTGYYVYHTQKDTAKTLNATNKTAASSLAAKKPSDAKKTSLKYLDIKQWGVKVAYTGSDTLSYAMNGGGKSASIISANLARQYDCTDMGAGQIGRYAPSDNTSTDGSGPTASQAARQQPKDWAHVGNYYYQFMHDNAACPNKMGFESTAAQNAQNAANDFVMSLVPKLTAD